MENLPAATPYEEPVVRTLSGFLARRKWTILGVLIVVVAAAVALTLVWPETYRSTTTVLIQQRQRGDQVAQTPALSPLERVGRGSVLETETELIQSRRVLEPVVDSLDLHVSLQVGGREARPTEVFPSFEAGRNARRGEYRIEHRAGQGFVLTDVGTGTAVARAAAGSDVEFGGLRLRLPLSPATEAIEMSVTPFQVATSGILGGALDVGPVNREGDILEIGCTASTPEEAQRLCDAVAQEYLALRGELQRADASGTADFLRQQVERLGDSLAVAEDSLEAFKKRAQVVALEEQANEEVRQYAQFKAQRDMAEAERAALASVLRRTEQRSGGTSRYRDLASFPSLLGNQTVSFLMQELGRLETQRAELARRRTAENPELIALNSRISEIDRQVGAVARQYEQSLGAQVSSLDRALGGSSGRLSSYPERQVEAARLEREVASLSAIYGMLETRLREAEVAEAVEQPPVRILDVASRPLRPSSPSPLLNLVLAIILGLGFGLAVGLAREVMDTRVHDRRILARKTSLPILAMLPRVKRARPILPIASAPDGEPVKASSTPPGNESGPQGAVALPAPVRARGAAARGAARAGANGGGRGDVALEVFRSLGTDLQFVARRLPKGDLRSIAITSAGRGEGKTYTACNLAIARASFGIHTLLIDADMRAGGVARFLSLEPTSPGLSDLLSGRATAREARRTLRINGGDVLSVMPAGEATPHAGELLETSYFEAMLAGAQAVYDLVVIDTPPFNVLSDAAAVVASVDAVLVVVREGVTDGDALALTLERLERAGGNVVGVVLNEVPLPKQYQQYTYGSYSYGR